MEKKTALITGGTSGIGFETAKKFLKNGYQVLVCSADGEERVSAAMAQLTGLGTAAFCALDVADEACCRAAVDCAIRTFGRIDVLLNIAGVVGTLLPITETDMADVKRTVGVDLMGTIYMSYYASKDMIARGSGVIVNMSSISGSMVTNHGVGYHAAKSGVNMATKVIARALAEYGVRCVAVAPGSVNTAMQDPKYADASAANMLKNRLIEPEEIADVIYLLCLDEASAINGTTVMADDGFTSFKSLNW